jgi:hypothetical protein
MQVGVKNFLTCGLSDIRAEIESLHVRVFPANGGPTRQRKLMQSLALFGGGLENVLHVPFGDKQRVERTHGEFVSDGEGEVILAHPCCGRDGAKWAKSAHCLDLPSHARKKRLSAQFAKFRAQAVLGPCGRRAAAAR